MSLTLLKNAKLLDPTKSDLQDCVAVLFEAGRIREVSPRPIRAAVRTTTSRDCALGSSRLPASRIS